MDPTDPWATLGARVVEAKGARGARVGGGVTVVSLHQVNFLRTRAVSTLSLGTATWCVVFERPGLSH